MDPKLMRLWLAEQSKKQQITTASMQRKRLGINEERMSPEEQRAAIARDLAHKKQNNNTKFPNSTFNRYWPSDYNGNNEDADIIPEPQDIIDAREEKARKDRLESGLLLPYGPDRPDIPKKKDSGLDSNFNALGSAPDPSMKKMGDSNVRPPRPEPQSQPGVQQNVDEPLFHRNPLFPNRPLVYEEKTEEQPLFKLDFSQDALGDEFLSRRLQAAFLGKTPEEINAMIGTDSPKPSPFVPAYTPSSDSEEYDILKSIREKSQQPGGVPPLVLPKPEQKVGILKNLLNIQEQLSPQEENLAKRMKPALKNMIDQYGEEKGTRVFYGTVRNLAKKSK